MYGRAKFKLLMFKNEHLISENYHYRSFNQSNIKAFQTAIANVDWTRLCNKDIYKDIYVYLNIFILKYEISLKRRFR